jgi:hypothetical protein
MPLPSWGQSAALGCERSGHNKKREAREGRQVTEIGQGRGVKVTMEKINREVGHAYDNEKIPAAQGNAGDATAWVKKTLMPVLKEAKGFKAYYAVAFDDGTVGSLNVFENEAAANEANKQVHKEVGNSASDMLQHVETKVWKILHEDHARRAADTVA